MAVAVVAISEFGAPEGLGVVSGVLAAEALLAGAVGTVERRPGLVAAAAGCVAGAYGCLAGWLQWGTDVVVGATAVVGWRSGGDGHGPEPPADGPGAGCPVAPAAARPGAGGGGGGVGGRSRRLPAGRCADGAGRGVRPRGGLCGGERSLAAGDGGAAVDLGRVRRRRGLPGPGCGGPGGPGRRPVGAGRGRPRPGGGDRATAWRGPGHPWRAPAAGFAAVVAAGAVLAATWIIGSPYAHTAAALAFGGADLVAVGVLTRRPGLRRGRPGHLAGRRSARLPRAPRLHQPPDGGAGGRGPARGDRGGAGPPPTGGPGAELPRRSACSSGR